MMPAVTMAPVGMVVASGAPMADDTRAMHGQHPAAAFSSDKGGSFRAATFSFSLLKFSSDQKLNAP
jgi:hypothetical protein